MLGYKKLLGQVKRCVKKGLLGKEIGNIRIKTFEFRILKNRSWENVGLKKKWPLKGVPTERISSQKKKEKFGKWEETTINNLFIYYYYYFSSPN